MNTEDATATAPAVIKVSVVVATYCPGKGLDRLVASLDAQTLPADDWEAIFVDDGSPDDTVARLTELAATRPHFRVTRIENSGWASRPRNVGIEMARGEYIAFIDHDDEFFPDALRAGHAYAAAHGADMLNAKEARTTDAAWAIEQFAADIPQVLGVGLPFSAARPTNPHKLYRRAFLIEHGIRFPEGGRVLWEDIFFNVDVLAHAEVVSTLSSVPYYHWCTTAGSGSTTFLRNRPEWWHWLNEVIVAIDARLAAPELEHERAVLRGHQYRDRLIDAFNDAYVRRPADERKLVFEKAARLQTAHYPAPDDRHLDVGGRLRADLLRRGHPHAMEELLRADPTLSPAPVARVAEWRDGRAHVEIDVDWRDGTGERPRLRSDGTRLFKDLPAPFGALFSDEQTDVTAQVANSTASLGIRSGKHRIAWLVPGSGDVRVQHGAAASFSHTANGTIDPATAAMGSSIGERRWDITAHCVLGARFRQPRVRSTLDPAIRVARDAVQTLHTDKAGCLVLDTVSPDPLALVAHTGRVRQDGGRMLLELHADEIASDADSTEFTAPLDAADQLVRRRAQTIRRVLRRPAPAQAWIRRPALLRVIDGALWLSVDPRETPIIRLGALRPDGEQILRVASLTARGA